MKIIFMGSSTFGLPALEAIAKNHELVAVYTNPPRPSGRGMQITKTPIHRFAESKKIPCYTPTSIRSETEKIKEISPEIIVVAAYGFIIPKEILDIPKYGCINIHGSLLPNLRGSSPIQHSLLCGDTETGITLMLMDPGIDTGDILIQSKYTISLEDNYTTLLKTLSELAVKSIISFLENPEMYLRNKISQNNDFATFSKKFNKIDFKINFNNNANSIVKMVKAFHPNAWFDFKGIRIKAIKAEIFDHAPSHKIGTLLDEYMTISCQDYAVRFIQIKPESKKEMSGYDFILNYKSVIGQLI